MHPGSMAVDPIRLAAVMGTTLSRNFVSAKVLDRGAYAAVYHLIESPSTSSKHSQPVVVRVSCRPAYNDVALQQERQKILGFVATLDSINGLSSFFALFPMADRCTGIHSFRPETSVTPCTAGTGI